MTQMYDPHEEWDREVSSIGRGRYQPPLQNMPGSLADKLSRAMEGFAKPEQNMTDRAHERDRRDTGTPDK